jgi:hypothetical protein
MILPSLTVFSPKMVQEWVPLSHDLRFRALPVWLLYIAAS